MKRPFARWSGLRARLLSTVLLTIAVVLAALTAAFNVVLADRLHAHAHAVASARAAAELAALRIEHGRVVLPETPDQGSPDAGIWVLQGGRVIEAPPSAIVSDQDVTQLAAEAPASRDLPGSQIELVALPVEQRGRRVAAVVAGLSLAPYQQTRITALIGSVLLAVAAFIAVGLACNWLIRRALRPIARMTRQAADWSEHDIDRRFNLGVPRDEFTMLAATLDDLLGRLAAGLRHEQRLSAEISHELRTPLATIRAEAQFALRHTRQLPEGRQALEQILTATRRMTAALDTLIAAARAQLDLHRASSDASAAARAAADACEPLAHERKLEISIVPTAERLPVACEQHLVERILSPLVENACRHASHRIRIELRRAPGAIQFAILDDGPGVPAEDIEAIFEPGWQAQWSPNAAVEVNGAGLGLALSRRLARTAGGDVRAQGGVGGRFVVQLPAAG